MKKLRRKNGFTLVECVVAMAVLAIMSLLLMMILSVTLKTRNANMQLEKELDEQLGNLAAGTDTVAHVTDTETIDIDGISITANKVYGQEGGVGRLENNFKDYFDKLGTPTPVEDNATPGANPESLKWEKTKPCFGHVDLKEGTGVNIYYDESTNMKDESGTYTVEWRVTFDVNSRPEEDSVKITLPTGAKFIDWSTNSVLSTGNYNHDKNTVRKLTEYIIMIRPKDADSDHIDVYLYFTISKKDYEDNFDDLRHYFSEGKEEGTSSPYTVEKGNFQ